MHCAAVGFTFCYWFVVMSRNLCSHIPIAGKDATQDFEEIGHSNSAKKLLEKYHIGQYEVCMQCCKGGMPSAENMLTGEGTERA